MVASVGVGQLIQFVRRRSCGDVGAKKIHQLSIKSRSCGQLFDLFRFSVQGDILQEGHQDSPDHRPCRTRDFLCKNRLLRAQCPCQRAPISLLKNRRGRNTSEGNASNTLSGTVRHPTLRQIQRRNTIGIWSHVADRSSRGSAQARLNRALPHEICQLPMLELQHFRRTVSGTTSANSSSRRRNLTKIDSSRP